MALFRQSAARPRKPWPVALAVVFILGTILTAFAVVGGGPLGHAAQSAYGAPSGGGAAQASAAVQPIRATANWSKTLPARSAAERQAEARAQALHNQLKAAPVGPHPDASQAVDPRTVNRPVVAPKSAAAPKPGQQRSTAQTAPGGPQQVDSDLVSENFSYILSAGVCPTDCATSDVAETSVGNDGKHIMLSFNWGDAVSHDNAGTWGFIDPYTFLTGAGVPGFCCDQQILYEPSRDRMWWEALEFGGGGSAENGILLWSSPGTNLGSWCGYFINGPSIGEAAGTLLDYPQIDFSANFVYLTINSYDSGLSWFSSTVMRMPLTAWSTCTSGAFQYLTRVDNFSYALAQGATDTMYWDSNWYTTMAGTGTTARIFFWPEGSNSYTFYDKTLGASWVFFGEGSVNCASSDSVVTNWCGRLDPRRGTLFRSRAGFKGFGAPMLGMAWTSGPSGCTIGGGVAYPYVVANYFLLSTLTWKQTEYFFSCATPGGVAIAYPSMAAPVQRGYIGGNFSYGGGLGGVDFYPTNFFSVQDPNAAGAPGSDAFWSGFGNGYDTGWGDYNTVRPWNPDGLHWMAAGWLFSAGTSFPYIFIFGRYRDHNAYLRWSTT